MKDVVVDGMVISPSVVDTIISVAAENVDGVAAIGSSLVQGGIIDKISGKIAMPGVEFEMTDDDKLAVGVHIEAIFGMVLPEVAANVRNVVAEALETQLGVDVASVDVYVDGIRFE